MTSHFKIEFLISTTAVQENIYFYCIFSLKLPDINSFCGLINVCSLSSSIQFCGLKCMQMIASIHTLLNCFTNQFGTFLLSYKNGHCTSLLYLMGSKMVAFTLILDLSCILLQNVCTHCCMCLRKWINFILITML